MRLLLHEHLRSDGGANRTWLELADGKLALSFDEGAGATIEIAALEAVMTRYGKPLADDIVSQGPTLALEGGRKISILRHRALYDAVARDFVVYESPGREPLAELATSVSAALVHLARAAARH